MLSTMAYISAVNSIVSSVVSTGGGNLYLGRRGPVAVHRGSGQQTNFFGAGGGSSVQTGSGLQLNLSGAVPPTVDVYNVGTAGAVGPRSIVTMGAGGSTVFLNGRRVAGSLPEREQIAVIEGIKLKAHGDKKFKLRVILEREEKGATDPPTERVVDCAALVIDIDGDAGKVTTATGDVGVSGNAGSVSSTNGNVEVKGNVTGSASTTSGDINVGGDIAGSAKTMSGDIDARDIRGGASTMSGDVRADSISGGSSSISGSVRDAKRSRVR
jgi:hypothetical protein